MSGITHYVKIESTYKRQETQHHNIPLEEAREKYPYLAGLLTEDLIYAQIEFRNERYLLGPVTARYETEGLTYDGKVSGTPFTVWAEKGTMNFWFTFKEPGSAHETMIADKAAILHRSYVVVTRADFWYYLHSFGFLTDEEYQDKKPVTMTEAELTEKLAPVLIETARKDQERRA